LPYALGVLGVLSLLVALIGKRVLLYVFTTIYLVFGVAFMYDFWRWEYDYGHNLDPNAAIVVPGMSYQPPLIGSKQLLNFTAHSYPDIGGGIMIATAFILMFICYLEFKKARKI
jgi:copper chaperone NosL